MVIVHVLNSLTIGGLEKVVVGICNNIDLKKNKVYILTLSDYDLEMKAELNKNIEIISLPFKNDSLVSILSLWFLGIPKIFKILNILKPQIIHSHLYYHYFLFLSISLKFLSFSPAHFRTIHTSGLFYASNTLLNKFRLLIEKISMRIYPVSLISISKQIQDKNINLFLKFAKKIRMIPNGIDLQKFSKINYKNRKSDFKIKENDIVISYVSRLDYGKNHKVLLQAIKECLKLRSNIHCCIIGDGILMGTLVQQAKELNIEKNITFFGSLNDVTQILSITDIGVFPSQFEGFPISLIEKMAMALPVVTSDIDIFKDLIKNNENGIICQVDNFYDYAEKLIKLIENENIRLEIGENARKTVEKYDIKTISNETIEFYKETLSI